MQANLQDILYLISKQWSATFTGFFEIWVGSCIENHLPVGVFQNETLFGAIMSNNYGKIVYINIIWNISLILAQ